MKPPVPDLSPETVFRQIRDGLLVLDQDGRILFCNDNFLEMIGRGGEDLRGRSCAEIFDGETCRRIDPRHLPPMEDEGQAHFNLSLPSPDGRIRSYCFVASPLRNSEGKVVAVLENFRGMDKLRDMILELEEVTQLAKREKEKTQRVLNSIADGVFTVDRERRILSFSDKMARLTGVPAGEAIGRTCMEVLKATRCDTDCPLMWSFQNGQVVENCPVTLRTPAGEIPVFVTTAFLHDTRGGVAGMTGVVHDRSEVERLRRALEEQRSRHGLLGDSPAMREVIQVVETVADTDAIVLITGESGTGKEIVARTLHRLSSRRDKPFVTVNCASLNDNLLESELFAHVRGAFTGAVRDKPGRFEMAAGGTIFLDEIGDTTPALQVKLLRVLQEKTFERVGDDRSRTVDIRILAATNRDLGALVRNGRFREDLYYRLSVVPIHLPALRQRREDIPLLVQHFIEKFRPLYYRGHEGDFEGISNHALALLMAHDWPGNIRELEHAIEYAMISTTTRRIERASLPAPLRGIGPPATPPPSEAPGESPAGATEAGPDPPPAQAVPQPAGEGSREALRLALERNRWSITRTARELGISRTTLWRRMKALDLSRRSVEADGRPWPPAD